MSRIAIIGAGAWGTALALVLGRNPAHNLRLWALEAEVCRQIATTHVNQTFLPGILIPEGVYTSNNLEEVLSGAEIVLSAVPSQHVRTIFEQMAPHLAQDMLFVSATKGIEKETYKRMSQVISETVCKRAGFAPRIGALSGPTFAREVGCGDPTALTIASTDYPLAMAVQREFSDPSFRVYMNSDVVGVELGGSLKNVIAIAAGIVEGLGFGHNTAAALITRGLAEMTRLAVTCGAKPETLAGLAGMGDLVLTCTGGLSRNRTVGVELGKGKKLNDIMAAMHGMVAEGVLTTAAALGLAKKNGIEMPITEQMDAILHRGRPPKDAIRELMTRPGKVE